MLKKIGLILIALAAVAGMSWILYQELFVASSGHFRDIQIVYSEGELRDKEKVSAECSIASDNRFCFKDSAWAEKENRIEFEGYIIVEYTNNTDLVTEVSVGTTKLVNVTEGELTIKSTNPSDIFIATGETVAVRYEVSMNTKSDEATKQIRNNGANFSATLTSELGRNATETFVVEYKN